MKITDIERRLSEVEREVAALKSTRGSMDELHPIKTLEAIHARFEDDDAFREAARLGRKWRENPRHKLPRSRVVKK